MNKEEKEAIEQIKYLIKFTEALCIYSTENKAYKIVLNLIEKLQKENEELQKENKKYIDIFNSTEKIMNGQERTKDKLLKENVELQKENEELKEQRDNAIKLRNELIEEQKITCVSKNKIRDKIKELEEELIKIQEIMKEKHGVWNWNDTLIILDQQREVLKELLGE